MVSTNRKILIMSVAAFLFVVNFGALAQGSNTATPSGEFIFGTPVSTSVSDLNPLTVSNSLATIIDQETYANSLGFQWADGTFTPWLASSWSITYSGTSENITYHLNPNADWVQGSNVVGQITGKDVAYTFKAILGNSSLDGYNLASHLTSVTSWDNNSAVSFNFNSTSALWFTYVTSQVIIPSSWSQYDNGTPGNIGSYLNMGPYAKEITAGPFTLSNISSQGAILVANTHFWMGTPHIETFYVEKFQSTSSAVLSLEDGSIAGTFPALSDYNALKGTTNITNVNQAEPWTFYLWMNDTLPTFANYHFRQGLAYAINKTQIMQKAEDGLGSWGSNFSFGGLPTVMKSQWAPNLTQYSFNNTKALHQFELAGYHQNITSSGVQLVNNTTKKQLTLTIQEPPVSDWQAAGTFIQSDLKVLGINAVLLSVPFSTWGADTFGANFTTLTYFGYVPAFTNPYIQLQAPYDYNGGFWNVEHFSNSTLNGLFNTTISATGTNFTKDLNQMQQIIDQQVPIVPIGNANNFYAYNNKMVQGFLPNLTMDSPYNLMQITSSYTPPTTPATTSSNNILYYLAGGVAAAIVVGGVVGYALRGKGNKGKEEK
ncbi:MAG: ABC transporter substrate-binding protein [Candidatus Thermoplasmatota archaeon]|nr:ABC transporter substrate-binding protein [Candidatus Thermoplasmatota archaeon]MCL6089501.1 ABC transporter substrate-binding protein [Candidatus Thermoplasmatota archaeon]MDA8143212.1 ABC transporter substrate-binding protein [Thermoplasmatales archaeon]